MWRKGSQQHVLILLKMYLNYPYSPPYLIDLEKLILYISPSCVRVETWTSSHAQYPTISPQQDTVTSKIPTHCKTNQVRVYILDPLKSYQSTNYETPTDTPFNPSSVFSSVFINEKLFLWHSYSYFTLFLRFLWLN